MVMDVLNWVLLLVACGITFVFFLVFMKLRLAVNKAMAVSSENFFSCSERLMNVAEELPDRILEVLETMSLYANDPRSKWAVIRAIRAIEPQHPTMGAASAASSELDHILGEMRPDLRDLFLNAVVAWLMYVSNRSVVAQFQMLPIALQMRSRNSRSAEERVGIDVLAMLPRLRAG